jgi:ABC-type multidrug transport system fused ATPase/permease subunit
MFKTGRIVGCSARTILINQLFHRSLSQRIHFCKPDVDGINNGKIMTMMSVDVENVRSFLCYSQDLFVTLPISLLLSLYSLYNLLGNSSFAGVFVLVLFSTVTSNLGTDIAQIEKSIMLKTESRIAIINECLKGIRIIKYLALEKYFIQKIEGKRNEELSEMIKLWKNNIWSRFLCSASVVLITLFTFTFYTLISGKLETSIAFTSINLFNQLCQLSTLIPRQMTHFLKAKISIIRITDIINNNQHNAVPEKLSVQSIILKGASFSYFGSDSISTLCNLNIEFPVGKLSLITGPTGSGKSSLLLALLGEMELKEGHTIFPYSTNSKAETIAYVAQMAWLINSTIRDNIIFGQDYDIERYKAVLEGCCLLNDFESFEHGDLTMIGENGSLLSGGQKQRVSLARACYSKARYVFLDDPFSAVDAVTARCLAHRCLLGLLKDRTVILVSNSIKHIIPYSDYTVVMKRGEVFYQGSPDKVQSDHTLDDASLIFKNEIIICKEQKDATYKTGSSNVKYVEVDHDDNCTNYDEGEKPDDESNSQSSSTEYGDDELCRNSFDGDRYSNIFQPKKIQIESKASFRYFMVYFKAAGGKFYFAIFITFFLLTTGSKFASDWWIKAWTSYNTYKSSDKMLNLTSSIHTSKISPLIVDEQCLIFSQPLALKQSYFIIFYALIGLSNIIILNIRELFILTGNFRASRQIHFDLVNKILYSPLQFFDITPLGAIINRFSEDIATVDSGIMFSITSFLNQILHSITIIYVIATGSPLFILMLPVLLYFYYKITKEYRLKSKELKKVGNKTRSSLYTQFSETFNGSCTIRAYGYEPALKTKMLLAIEENHKAYLNVWELNRCFCLNTEVMSSFVVFIVGILVLFGNVDTALASLVLNYTFDFTNTLCWSVKHQAAMEMNIASGYFVLI